MQTRWNCGLVVGKRRWYQSVMVWIWIICTLFHSFYLFSFWKMLIDASISFFVCFILQKKIRLNLNLKNCIKFCTKNKVWIQTILMEADEKKIVSVNTLCRQTNSQTGSKKPVKWSRAFNIFTLTLSVMSVHH